MLPEEAAGQIVEAVAQVRETGKSRVLEYSSNSGDQPAYFEVKTSPVSDSKEVLVVVDNITDRKLAELAEHDQRVLAEAMRDIAILLNSTLDLEDVFDRILANIERVVACDVADIMLIDVDHK